ncbi:aspartate aminotransferase [Pseudoroseomonas deserti]|uniref:Aspartate aminotransferase n=1 Tax=Teichococcus deserti TaxID=1817963 RepID=A0A1V2H353_9PROT|nr:PLP-dependent aminotransferase family protein [Pseudoroseomonas deserti]ONG54709.1 aspartate aminotransferase [Pseudoroseomonas deserti]
MDAVTTPRWAQRMQQVQPNAIGELLRLGAEPGVMSFGGGYPDAGLFPIAGLEEVFRDAIGGTGGAALQYTVAEGRPQLRAQIAARMAADGAPCSVEEVLVLQGGQQGLDLLGRLLLDPGDVVVTEDPTFLGALIAFDPCQPRYAAVPMDAEGMDTDALEAVLKATPQARVIYTIPDFQNPTGVTMSLPRRRRLLELAEKFDLMVIEDTPYRPLRFAGEHLPTLKSLDRSGRVIFLGSFSKILAPGLRLGWAVASRPVIERLTLLKLAADTQCSTLNMAAASLFLERFDVDAHIATIRAAYAEKKEKMLGAIRRHFPQSVTCTDPEGGMFTWLTFPEGFDATAFMRDHALPKARVAYVPGASFFPVTPRPNHARLSYSAPDFETIERGMAALGGLLKRHL